MGYDRYTVRVYLVWSGAGSYSTRFRKSGFGPGVDAWQRIRVWRLINLDREDRWLWRRGGYRLHR